MEVDEEQAQEYLQRQAMANQARFESLNGNEMPNDFLRWHLDLDENLFGLKMRLLGKDLNMEGQWVKVTESLVNEQGANNIVTFVSAYLCKMGELTNLEDKDIKMLLKDCRIEVIKHLALNYYGYELAKGNFTLIETMVDAQVKFVLKMSFKDGTRNHLHKSMTRTEQVHRFDNGQQQKGYRLNNMLT